MFRRVLAWLWAALSKSEVLLAPVARIPAPTFTTQNAYTVNSTVSEDICTAVNFVHVY